MARLECKTEGMEHRVVDLKLGVNRLGRSTENDVCLNHFTISSAHCEVVLGCGQVSVRDCASTNGTFLNGKPVQEAVLLPGQILRLGEVELLVADTEVPVAIPKFEKPLAPPPVILANGALLCRRHRGTEVTYRCQHCGELLCEHCIHKLRRRGGKLLRLCPLCSYQVELTGGEKKVKKSLFKRLCETTRMLFTHRAARN